MGTMAADVISDKCNIDQKFIGSVDLDWTGSDADTTAQVQVSNDCVNWKTLACGEITLTSGSGYETFGLGKDTFTHRYLRVNFEAGAATTGLLTVIILTKRGTRGG